jgi:hypothetical protein
MDHRLKKRGIFEFLAKERVKGLEDIGTKNR